MIAKIKTLKGTGVFENLCSGAESPKFTHNNLIYGFNGSGKTTLGRVFASLGAGALHGQLATASFEIELADGTVVKSKESLDALKGRLFVFNVDFIEENLKWREGAANPVFYIGKEQAGFADKLKGVETELQAAQANQPKLQQAFQKATKSFNDFKRDTARTIAEQIALARRYDASTLATDYQGKTYDATNIIPEEEVTLLLSSITQAAPLPKLDQLRADGVELNQLVKATRRLLATTVGEIALKELQEHPRMVQWVKEGLEYHVANKIDICMLCGNALTEERKDAIKLAIDDRFTKLKQELLTIRDRASQIRRNMEGLVSAIPSQNDLSSELRTLFIQHDTAIREILNEGFGATDLLLKLLNLKVESINIEVKDTGMVSDEWAGKHDIAASDAIAQLNQVLESHNKIFDEFDIAKDKVRSRIKSHQLARNQASYKKLEGEVTTAQSAHSCLAARQVQLNQEAEELRRRVRTHGPASEVINCLVESYLGHNELHIKASEEGYQLLRKGQPITGTLSEGEKTAIALCYFLVALEGDGRKLKDLIVVVDDPISSLDTRALNYAFCLIKAKLKDAGQLILMTHNLNFMNEVKKWLKEQARKDVPTATLMFLDVKSDLELGRRCVELTELPRLIREYESEYQYLFFMAHRFAEGADGYQYLMPNVLRKILDTFLAFKIPNASGLASKIEKLTADYSLDATRIAAIERLTQIESHGDSLDDLVSFSSMSIEETKQSAKALFDMMRFVDDKHFNQMVSLCR